MELAALLHQTFGFPAFRANQEAVCRAATDGRDVLLVMPTGAGKSLCYQLPAIARGGTALVISPLIALMDDQASKLSAAGLRVARIHSGLSREDSRQACRDYLDGKLQFLFIAPERMRVPGFPEMLARRKPSLIAIDEAHCISAWGHDFRPDYRTLGDHLPALRPAPIIALTATATPAVQRDIVAQLNLVKPALFIHGFRRDNLAIEVVELSKPKRRQFTVDFLADKARRPAIVYAPSRAAAEELAGELGRKYRAAAYHAGLQASVREKVQAQFQSGRVEVVVATIAFGMGIDKADVRTVVHYALPASVEAYYQEIGRAGRDGQPSRTVLLYNFIDRRIHDGFLERDYPAVPDLARVLKALTDEFLMPDYLAGRLRMDRETVLKALEKLAAQGAAQFDMAGLVRRGPASGSLAWQTGYEQQVAFRRQQIERMMQFAETQQCRMTALIHHFGDTADTTMPCGKCDFCAPGGTAATSSGEPTTSQEQDLRLILKTLDGSTGKSTGKLFTELEKRLDSAGDRREFDALLDGLARAGWVTLASEIFTNGEGRQIAYKKASLTYEGQTLAPGAPLHVLLRSGGGESAPGNRKRSSSKTKAKSRDVEEPVFTSLQQALADNLRAWRKAEAAKTGKPAFIVFGDAALTALVFARPQTIAQLLAISGFGPDKAERYGAEIVALCRAAGNPSIEHAQTSAASPAPMPAKPTPSSPVSRTPRTQQRDPEPGEPPPGDEPRGHAQGASARHTLEERLRAWRQAESEKLGMPQFFVLGTTALRSIVLTPPRTLAQLERIEGVGADKVSRFGASILEVCNA